MKSAFKKEKIATVYKSVRGSIRKESVKPMETHLTRL